MSFKDLGLGTGRRLTIVLLATLLLASASAMLRVARTSGEPRDTKTASVTGWQAGTQATSVGASPLFFEPNQGQTDPRVKFMARGSGYGLFLTADQAVLKLGSSTNGAGSAVAMRLEGANTAANLRGTDTLPGKSNYLIGNDPKSWRTGISQFAQVEYDEIYPGVDLVYYGNQGALEYDFRVAPGADASRIAMSFEGAESIKLSQVSVELKTAAGDVRFEAPRVYQKFGDEERPVEGHFVQLAGNRVGFEVGDYDRSRTLVIDPVLSYSTYLGGTGDELGTKIAVDSGLNFYVAGTTTSTDFPVTAGVKQPALAPPNDAFIAKFDPSGSTLLFATYLGGTGTETVAGIGVDGGFNVYIGGTTTSPNYPPSPNAFQSLPKAPGTHAYVSQLNATGTTLLYSSYLSGSGTDVATGFAIDNRGNAYLTGTTTSSTDFPVTSGSFPWPLPTNPAIQFFVAKVNTTSSGNSSLAYSSYFGGAKPANGQAIGGGIAVDTSGNIYFTGTTNFQFLGSVSDTGVVSRDIDDFPILNATQPCLDKPVSVPPPNPPQACEAGKIKLDAFIAKITPPTGSTGPQLVYSTYLGGTEDDEGVAIAVDSASNAYVTGTTASADLSTSIPSPTAAFQKTLGGKNDAFIAKIGATKSTTLFIFPLNYLTFLGGSEEESGLAIVADTVQGVRVTGSTASANFPKVNPIQNALAGGTDAFVARIDTTAATATSAGQWATFLGGSGNDLGTGVAVDANNQTYVAGQTASGDFPTKNPFQAGLKGTSDAFITKIGAVSTLTLAGVPTPTTVGVGNALTFKYTITNTGPDPAFNVNFSDVLPGTGTTFTSATASPGSCTGATGTPAAVTCAIGTLAVNGTATVSIVVTPTTVAPSGIGNSATVTFNNGSTVTATVNPIPIVTDFRIDVSPSTATVVAGNTATYTATVTPLPTYSGSIALSCSAGLPSGASCTITSSPVTIPNASPVTAQLAIATTARPVTTSQSQFGGWTYALWLPIGGVALIGTGNRRRRWLAGLFVLVLVSFVGLQLGCGSSGTTPPVTSGTPAGTYTVTVSASSGSASRSTTLTLVVQ